MKHARSAKPVLTALATAILGALGSAHAGEIDTGNPDLAVRWDNTVKYNYGYRVNQQEQALLKSANFDDGDRNFDRGTVSSRVDLLSEFDLVYQKTMGVRVSGAGWFDGDPATMYATAPSEAYAEIVRVAGGANPVAARAEALVATDPALALRLTSAALAAEPKNPAALAARKHALEKLLAASQNSNESGWLHAGLNRVDAAAK